MTVRRFAALATFLLLSQGAIFKVYSQVPGMRLQATKAGSLSVSNCLPDPTPPSASPSSTPVLPSSPPASIYVSPSGSDTNSGTLASPFLTLARAQQQARVLAPAATSDIYVYLRGGTYRLNQTLSLGQMDSGQNGHSIHWTSYPGESAIISGGIPVSGWAEGTNGIWKAHIGPLAGVLQMYVNGVRKTRARTAAAPANVARSGDGFTTTDLTVASLHNLQHVQMISRWDYVWAKCPFDHVTVSAVTADIAISPQCLANATAVLGPGFPAPIWLENALEFLDTPGEWYFDDAAGDLYYMPQTGEDLISADVEVPVVETLISVMGQPNNPVQNITFSGLTFEYGAWVTGPDGTGPGTRNGFAAADEDEYFAVPIHRQPPGNVDLEFTSNVNFTGNTFSHMGATALIEINGNTGNAISGNTFTDISANGMTVGNPDNWQVSNSGPSWYNSDITINDNYVAYVNVDYPAGAGIVVPHGINISVMHNEVAYTPYMGIEVGFGLGSQDPTWSNTILVEYNLVHNFDQNTTDGGGIYFQDVIPNGAIAYNVVRDSFQPGKTFSPAIYLDLGNRYIEVHDNATLNNAVSYLENVTHDTTVDSLCYTQPPQGVKTQYGLMRCSGNNGVHDNWFENRVDASGNNTSIQFTGCSNANCQNYWDPTMLISLPAEVAWSNNSAQTTVTAPAAITQNAGIESQWLLTVHPQSARFGITAAVVNSCRRVF